MTLCSRLSGGGFLAVEKEIAPFEDSSRGHTLIPLQEGIMRGKIIIILLMSVGTILGQPMVKEENSVWPNGIGNGFNQNTVRSGFAVGGGVGPQIFGSSTHHDLIMGQVSAGWIFSDVLAKDKWYQGNWELLGDLFGGYQFNVKDAYVAGFTSSIRYNFATHSRWIPFVQGGGGPSLTDIGNPDLSTKFEFNIHAGVGVHYFWNERATVTVELRLGHLSNAHIDSPNGGVNTALILFGVNWFF